MKLFILLLSSMLLNAETITLSTGKQIIVKDDFTWSYMETSKNDTTYHIENKILEHVSGNYGRNYVQITFDVFNDTDVSIVAFKGNYKIKSPFKKIVVEAEFEEESVIEPKSSKNVGWIYEDNQFISDQPYDKLYTMSQSNNALIEAELTQIVFSDGRIWNKPVGTKKKKK